MASISGLSKDFQGASSTAASAKSDAATGNDTAPKPARATAALGSAVIVELSAQAKALATAGVTPQLFKTPEEDIQQRTEALAGKLTDVLKRAGIPADETISLKVDKFGRVTADGPYKKKIEEYFADNADAKELRAIVEYRTLQATQQALEALAREKKAARNDDETQEANTRFLTRANDIQRLDGQVTLQNGKLTTGAQDYITSRTVPVTADDVMSRDQALDRLAAFS
ncbi:hypothetical protein [Bosea sp. BK604]|uniref:hypothetical protein n=1 Tax=Bosea sp. BK604 TaxID=2512180 RepID=UPI0010441D33|nr:hypothetical protein [Bosea sp. BK604]TCR64977.1 hypothetical protein EV560_106444 [Bosea sp. BK604]